MEEFVEKYCNADLKDEIDILSFIKSNKKLEKSVEKNIVENFKIDIPKEIDKLENIGRMLSVAYTGCIDQQTCSDKVMEILSNYHTFIKTSSISSNEFVDGCIKATNYHQKHLRCILKDEKKSSIGLIICSELAIKIIE